MLNKTRIAAGVLVLFSAIGLSAVAVTQEPQEKRPNEEAKAIPVELVLHVEGMHCGNCAKSLTTVLKNTEGVVAADVVFESKEARIRFDETRISKEDLIALVEELGFEGRVKTPKE